jgi:lactate permease
MLVLSVIPLALFIILVFSGKIKLIWASLLALLLTIVLVIFVWKMQPVYIGASLMKGTFVAADILVIIFGALLFLETLRKTKIIDSLCHYLGHFSLDYRIQTILLAWFLENFLEGTAGFGTPSTVVAPLLVGVGFSPIIAVVVALLGNSASVVFGAAGTPIRVGFSGLDVAGVPLYSALINMIGFLVPVFMLWIITSIQKERKTHFLEALPFAVFSGLAFSIPSVFLVSLGQEFPSIVGSIVGLLIVLAAIKLKLFVPKTIRSLRPTNLPDDKTPIMKVLFPYILLVALLVVGKFTVGSVGYSVNFGIKHTFNLFNPGFAFIIASIPVMIIWWKDFKGCLGAIKQSFIKALEPFATIALISIMVQIMINSGQNYSGNYSFLQIIAGNLKTAILPLIVPAIGGFGSFLTGSATISNIMFGNILASISSAMGMSVPIILSLQLVGGAAGNMVSLADILPAQAVVGISGKEGEIIKKVIIPCGIYITLAGLIGLLIVYAPLI